ncbi:ATP-binding protein [Streptomyces sp. NPDC126514]|uniref:ATP-binding protein n=1 Tax=Streptomyces sp. NPDC126514 TaxID=3155210 RepID=UPI003320AF17
MIMAQLGTAPREEVEHILPVPHAAGAVSSLRRHVRAVLTDWKLTGDVLEDVLLVVSELLTNAIVHALPPATLRLTRGPVDQRGVVRVEVTDTGPAPPEQMRTGACDPDEHGRGLGIVTTLSVRCGVQVHSGGTSRWAEVLVGCGGSGETAEGVTGGVMAGRPALPG